MNRLSLGIIILATFFSSCSEQKSELTDEKNEQQNEELTEASANTEQAIIAFGITGKQGEVYLTESGSDKRLATGEVLRFQKAEQPLETEIAVFVNPKKQFQTFLGIGGAITDASAETFSKLPPAKQKEFVTAYYDQTDGIGYSLCRTPIHSCDFSNDLYTYIEEGDSALETFSIEHDRKLKIPLIKQATAAAGGELMLYASPWSPPAFMKDNKNMLKGGKLLPKYASSWAHYYAKFIKAYEKEGMPIWGITIQNEPMAVQRWQSCIYTAEEERDFLKNHLGPVLEKEGLGDKKIVVWDHNRDLISHRANTIFDDPEAAKYAWGIGLHWYETWTGGEAKHENLGNITESYPDKNILFTEGCQERFDPTKYQKWEHAERYGKSIIKDFNQGCVGFTDWNILLNQYGGPNHVDNFCFAPIHGDTTTGELIYTPSYYYIGHFSKFIRPGAKRVSTTTSRSPLLSTSFINEDGSLVIVVMNQSDDAIDYKLLIEDEMTELAIAAHAMESIVIK